MKLQQAQTQLLVTDLELLEAIIRQVITSTKILLLLVEVLAHQTTQIQAL